MDETSNLYYYFVNSRLLKVYVYVIDQYCGWEKASPWNV